MIDLRSDTVTKPTKEMLDFMMSAPVGDDVFGEDPTVNELENYTAELFGKEASIFCTSGTQSNQIGINLHVKPGGEVICHHESHVFKYEGGGIARNSGASIRTVDGDRGRLKASAIEKWINPAHDVHFPLTQLVSIEDTANRGGGAIYNVEDIREIRELCNVHNLPLHLDGARLFNALVETKFDYKVYAENFDTISICLSKGLGAPIGSLLIGTKQHIHQARRIRKVFGGGMRQAGIIAAGGLFALKNNVDRLRVDHAHAKEIEGVLKILPWIVDVVPVETNIVVAIVKDDESRNNVISKLKELNILCMPFGPYMIRFVTHLNISEIDVAYICDSLRKIN
ncbi:MAG: aminotransferase class I/II-fold pyridoxal phosphate-dependent enzyme [Bacteroidetes bacterium]|nr:aminotransferase class I/II-fold pyridoxal phosphate-dependent enzyme [Bacteroidota bacterium]